VERCILQVWQMPEFEAKAARLLADIKRGGPATLLHVASALPGT
jgi:hypothetical protein